MKKSLLLFISVFTFWAVQAQNINDLESLENAIKPGTQLTYDVSAGGKQYKFIVTIKKLGTEIAFDWKMTEPVNKTGSVAMTAAAVAKADALFNYFNGGPTVLEKETSVWISQKLFNDIATNAQGAIRVNGAADTVTVMSNTISEFNFNLNGNLVAVPGWELQGGSDIKYTIDVIESAKFPLIVRMDLGWTIALSEVKSQ
ncbi:MAG: hypothetical protein U0T75_10190 [Chitinophagales bacterium]